MKNLLLLTTVLLCCTSSFCQDVEIESFDVIFENELVKVSLSEGKYIEKSRNLSHSRYFLQYENLSNEEVEITLLKELHYGEKCYGCDNNEESYRKIVIPPNSILTYDQENKSKDFYFFIKDDNGLIKSQLTDFKIKVIKTTKL